MSFKEFHIIGAGAGGLSLALMLQKSGHKVTIYEAHSIPGGCASWYQRGPYRFDVGATTLSGMINNGPLQQFLDEQEIKLEMRHVDPGLVVHFNRGQLKRVSDNKLWIEQLDHFFPNAHHQQTWNHILEDAEKCWSILNDVKNFPPRNIHDLLQQLDFSLFEKVKLLPLLVKSFESYTNKYLSDPELKRIIDQLLLISTQSTSDDVAALVGILGAHYPLDTWYPLGGIGTFSETLASTFTQRGGDIKYSKKLIGIEQSGKDYLLHFKDQKISAENVVVNIPVWNLVSLCQGKMKSSFEKTSQRAGEAWGAMTCYGVVKPNEPIEALYHQVHDQKDSSLFFSFSDKNDHIRSPFGEQVFSVSTHIKIQNMSNKKMDKESYLNEKKIFQERVEQALKTKMGIDHFKIDSVGTPQTFERFTKRHNGWVGGIPHRMSLPLWDYPAAQTPFKNFWRVGDTVFPGQGIVGVISGAKILYQMIR